MNKLHKLANLINLHLKNKILDPIVHFVKDQYEYRFRQITIEDAFFFDYNYTRFFTSQIDWFFINGVFTKSNINDGLEGVFYKDITVTDTKRAGTEIRVLVALNKLPLDPIMFSDNPASRQRYIVEINFIPIDKSYKVYPSIVSSNLSLNELFGIFLSDASLSHYLKTYFDTSDALDKHVLDSKNK